MNFGPTLIAITGGSGTGKTTLARAIEQEAGHIALVSQDDYYIAKPDGIPAADYDFDRPHLIQWERLRNDIERLQNGYAVKVPVYEHATASHSAFRVIQPSPIIVVEGIFVLTDAWLRQSTDIRVFLDLDENTRLKRRLVRDIAERGCEEQAVMDRWVRFLVPAHKTHIEPQKAYCHLVLEEAAPEEMANRILDLLPSDERETA